MSSVTDPARELADLCSQLAAMGDRQQQGGAVLAAAFKVQEWSSEFYQLLFAVSRRADELIEIIRSMTLDEDTRSELVADVQLVQQTFTQNGLNNVWQHSVTHFISPMQVKPIRALSMQVRGVFSSPKLDEEEHAELLAEVGTLLDWLREHQLKDQDFIRQAIIDSLDQFYFRLERVGWVGWGYTLQSLREVIGAYLALERGLPESGTEPVAAAMLKKTEVVVKAVYARIKLAKDVTAAGDFLLKAYGAFALASQGPKGITALIAHVTTTGAG